MFWWIVRWRGSRSWDLLDALIVALGGIFVTLAAIGHYAKHGHPRDPAGAEDLRQMYANHGERLRVVTAHDLGSYYEVVRLAGAAAMAAIQDGTGTYETELLRGGVLEPCRALVRAL
jgi:hypothetical protein